VLGWPASETAALLETTVAAANSTLQRARATMQQHLPSQRSEWSAPEPTADERELLAKFIDAHERRDAAAAAAIASQDIRVTMPPQLMVFDGLDAIAPLLERAFGDDREGEWRLLPTTANRMPVLGLRMAAGNRRGNNSVTMSVAKAEEPSARIDEDRIRESGRFDGTGVAGTRWARHPATDVDHGPRNPRTVGLDELLE